MCKMRLSLFFMRENEHTCIPILYKTAHDMGLTMPVENMHMTFLVIKKTSDAFDLHWVNRPSAQTTQDLSLSDVIENIESMVSKRFSLIDHDQTTPFLQGFQDSLTLEDQGNRTNCVVSNLFAALDVLDTIDEQESAPTISHRYRHVRTRLYSDDSFYEKEFFPEKKMNCSLAGIWPELCHDTNQPI